MKISGIYIIQSEVNPVNFYIGSTSDYKRRMTAHFGDLRKNKHHSPLLQRHFNKYGKDSLKYYLWFTCPDDELLKMEQYCLDILNPAWNICKTAGNTLGYKHSPEAKLKISTAGLGNKYTLGRPPWNKGKSGYKTKPATELRKKRISESNKGKQAGEKHPNWGKNRSNETKLKISQIKKGHTVTEETRDKIRKSLIGRKSSMDARMKISMALKGKKKKPFTMEHRINLSKSHKKNKDGNISNTSGFGKLQIA